MSGSRRARFLGLDLGTSGLKALATDAHGEALACVSRPYPLLRPRPGWAEQEPAAWWGAIGAALDELCAMDVALDALDGIGLSGQMHGLVLLDAHGESLGPCQTWADSRCEREARAFERRVGRTRLLRLAGSHVYTSATAPKLLWTRRHEPQRLRAVARAAVVAAADWVVAGCGGWDCGLRGGACDRQRDHRPAHAAARASGRGDLRRPGAPELQ